MNTPTISKDKVKIDPAVAKIMKASNKVLDNETKHREFRERKELEQKQAELAAQREANYMAELAARDAAVTFLTERIASNRGLLVCLDQITFGSVVSGLWRFVAKQYRYKVVGLDIMKMGLINTPATKPYMEKDSWSVAYEQIRSEMAAEELAKFEQDVEFSSMIRKELLFLMKSKRLFSDSDYRKLFFYLRGGSSHFHRGIHGLRLINQSISLVLPWAASWKERMDELENEFVAEGKRRREEANKQPSNADQGGQTNAPVQDSAPDESSADTDTIEDAQAEAQAEALVSQNG